MCYELSKWSWKLRAAELARKERKAANPEKKQTEPAKPARPVTPEPRVHEGESIPA